MALELTNEQRRARLHRAIATAREIGLLPDEAAEYLTAHDEAIEKIQETLGCSTEMILTLSHRASENMQLIIDAARRADGSIDRDSLRSSRAMLSIVAWFLDRHLEKPETKQ